MAEERTKDEDLKDEQSVRDEGLDVAKATDIVMNWMRNTQGNLNTLLFRIEQIQQNSIATRYIIIASIVPDRAMPREYYLIKVDVRTGEIILPVHKGKLDEDNKFISKEIQVDE